MSMARAGATPENLAIKKISHSYKARSDRELTVKVGANVLVHAQYSNGWSLVSLNGQKGLVPTQVVGQQEEGMLKYGVHSTAPAPKKPMAAARMTGKPKTGSAVMDRLQMDVSLMSTEMKRLRAKIEQLEADLRQERAKNVTASSDELAEEIEVLLGVLEDNEQARVKLTEEVEMQAQEIDHLKDIIEQWSVT